MLSAFCTLLQLDVLRVQAVRHLQNDWAEAVEMARDATSRDRLKLSYWQNSSLLAVARPDIVVVRQSVRQPSRKGRKSGPGEAVDAQAEAAATAFTSSVKTTGAVLEISATSSDDSHLTVTHDPPLIDSETSRSVSLEIDVSETRGKDLWHANSISASSAKPFRRSRLAEAGAGAADCALSAVAAG
jgi:hypothetical protein